MAVPQIQPVNFFASYLQGRGAAQDEQAAQTKNALAQQNLGQVTRQNALYANPSATPEQFIRAGDTQTGTALQANQLDQRQIALQTNVLQSKQLASAAAAVEQSQQPKSLAEAQFPQFAQDFESHHGPGSWASLTDDQVRQMAAGIRAHATSQAGELPPAPIKLDAGQQLRNPNNPSDVIASAPGKVAYEDAGDQKIPVDSSTGVVRKDIPPIKKGVPPGQQFTDQSVESTAQMIANGQIPMISGFALKTPWGQQVVARVGQIAPATPGEAGTGYQGGEYAARNKTLNDFTSGKAASTVRSLNVGIAHLGTLGDLASALDNGNVQLINKLSNTWKTQTGGTAPTNFAAARSIVANEVVKAVTASGGGVTDRKEAQDEVSSASSPQQLQQVISTWKQLLSGQLGGLKQQYEQGTKRQDFNRFLSPEVISHLEPAGGPAASAPTATGPNGQKLVLKNGQWTPQ